MMIKHGAELAKSDEELKALRTKYEASEREREDLLAKLKERGSLTTRRTPSSSTR